MASRVLRPGGDAPNVAPDADMMFAYKLGSGCVCGRQPNDGESAEGWINWVPKDRSGQFDFARAQLVCPDCAKNLA
jgi:hypothetical protein